MTFVPVPGVGAGSFAPDANLANWIDANYLPGRLWDITRDPEGLLSTLPAIATCLLGVLAGLLFKNESLTPARRSLWLIGGGVAMVAAGYLWSFQFPIVKAIWTSSFVLVAGGYSAILLGILHQVVDVWGWKAWTTIFVWIGVNAITLYFINGVVGFQPFARRFVGGDLAAWLNQTVTPGTGLFVTHVVGLAFAVALAGFLYRRKIFVRV
jgi:predicted acyltransferase